MSESTPGRPTNQRPTDTRPAGRTPTHPQRTDSAPIDPDVDLSVPEQRREFSGHHPAILGVIAAGGVIGALLRFQIGRWWPTPTDHFPAATLTINLSGCLAIGILLAVIGEMRTPHPFVRPFVGTGILGGFTTFSTYAVDIQTLLRSGHGTIALAYLAITAIGAVLAVSIGLFLTRRLARGSGA